MSSTDQHKYLKLMRRIEELVDVIDQQTAQVPVIADQIICKFRHELGIYGGRMYERDGEHYLLVAIFPDAKPVEKPIRIPRTYAPMELCLQDGTVYMDEQDPRLDKTLEEVVGAREFAGVEVGRGQYILAFDVESGQDRNDILFSLSMVRYAINQQLRQEHFEDAFRQAREIQISIQPRTQPNFAPFDIAGRSQSAESVGGDYYDYIPITDKILGLAIADVTGHGLPAALQVRDIYTGLRMGLGRDYKIVRTVERLNSIIHESTLTSRFVSMIYGELESNGTFIYVNAGHPAPFHLSASGQVTFLDQGGPVLGPLADASYLRGFVRLMPGDVLVAYTDGITEAPRFDEASEQQDYEEYGISRLIDLVRQHQSLSARALVDKIFEEADAWQRDTQATDDRTVLVLSYPEH